MTPRFPLRLRLVACLLAAGLLGGLVWKFTGASSPQASTAAVAQSPAVKAEAAAAALGQEQIVVAPPADETKHELVPDRPLRAALDGATPSYRLFGSAWGNEPKPELAAFDDWAKRYLAAAAADKAKLIPEGLALAAGRMALLKELIKTDPRQVIASTVPMGVRTLLPAEITGQLEKRVSGVGQVNLLGSLAEPGGTVAQSLFRSTMVNGQEYETYVYGRREAQTTKVDISIAGVAIGAALALSESPLRALDPGEVPPANAEVSPVCPVSKDPTPTDVVAPQNTEETNVVEVGGKIYHLCHMVHLADFERQLINAENAAGPFTGALTSALTEANGQPGTSGVSGRPPASWSTGTKKVIVIRVDFSDLTGAPVYPGNSATIDPAFVVNAFTQTNGINDFYSQASYGQAALSISTSDVTAVLRMPHTAAYYAQGNFNTTLHSDAEAAATSAGFNLANYDRIGVVFSRLSTISGSQITYGGLGDVYGPKFWINGWFDFRDCAHEIGHTFGLQHCNLWQVSDGNPISASGSSTEYGDPFGVMSAGSTDINYHFDMWQKSILHWIPDSSVTTISAPGTYRVYRFDHSGANLANPLGLKIVRNATQDYWIGLRQLFTSNSSLMNGAYILWGYNSVVQGNLLDMTTPGTSAQDAALATGATFTDSVAGITIKPLSKGGTTPNEYLDVQVNLSPSIQWQASSYNVDEKLGTASVVLTRTANSTGAVSVNYSTTNGTATAPANYTATSGTVSWADGDSAAKTISIPITTSAVFNGLLNFTVNLTGITGGVIANSTTATVNIASAGTTDPGFNANFVDSTVVQTAVQPDGKILIAGWFSTLQDASFTTYTRNGFARLNADGSVDTTFGSGTGANSVPINAMVLQPDGKVLIAGSFTSIHGTTRNAVARLNSDGSLDTTFDPGSGSASTVRALALQPDGKILVGGDFTTFGGVASEYLARLNPDGTVDTSFVGPNFTGTSGWQVYALALQPDGKILAGGVFYFSGGPFSGGKFRAGSVRMTSSGSVDTTYDTGNGAHTAGNTGSLQRVRTISVQRDGSVVLGGDFTGFNNVTHNHLVRVSSTGVPDSSFTPSTDGNVYTTLVQADGKVLVGGSFANLDSTAQSNFGRLNADGTLDTVFGAGSGSTGTVYDFAMEADGRVFLGGDYATIQGVAGITVARLFTGMPGVPGTIQLAASALSGNEGTTLTVTATRTGGSYGATSMNYGTQTGTAASTRYTPAAGTLSWADGDAASKTFTVSLINDGITEAAQTFTLNLGVPIGGVVPGSPGTATVTVSTSPYGIWQQARFSFTDLQNSSIIGDKADPDADGISNLLEYAFGFDPKTANTSQGYSTSTQNVTGVNYLTLTYRTQPTATDLTYTPMSGPDLQTWNGVPVQVGTPVSNGDGTQSTTFRDSVPESSGPRRFMRLQVTRTP